MAARRQDKINEEVARELTSILRTVKDPRVSGAFISVTGADVSRDLSLARVYYSVLGSADGADKGLASAAGYIRSDLAARLNLRSRQAGLSARRQRRTGDENFGNTQGHRRRWKC
ncbi:MAG: 30S ribosome-binding factor RbfA [Acutalibacteraceae bacterium]